MKPIAFYCILALALIFGVVTVVEIYMYQSLDMMMAHQKELSAKTQNAQRIDSLTRQMLQRLADDSQHDPALAELLKKHDVKVVVPNQTPAAATTEPVAPVGADKAASPSPNPTSSHP